MKRSADYVTDNGVITVRPNMIHDENEDYPHLAYITIFSPSSKVHINVELVNELKEILDAIDQRYISKSEELTY